MGERRYGRRNASEERKDTEGESLAFHFHRIAGAGVSTFFPFFFPFFWGEELRAMKPSLASVVSLAVVLLCFASQLHLLRADEDPSSSSSSSSPSSSCPPAGFDSISNFNLSAWTEHPWFIQEQMANAYQKPPFYCVRASYTPQEGGKEVKVFNTASLGGVDGGQQNTDMFLKAVVVNGSKLAVGPEFIPQEMYGSYWIVFAGPDEDSYDYGIVSGGPPKNSGDDGCIAGSESEVNEAGLWLFTKDPVPEPGMVDMLREKATELGFDLSVLQNVTHEGCKYPPIPV